MNNTALQTQPDLWESIKTNLKKHLGSATYKSWIEPLAVVSIEDSVLILSAPTQFMADWVEGHFASKIKDLSNGHLSNIIIEVNSALKDTAKPQPKEEPKQTVIDFGEYNESISSRIDPRFKFENFIVGISNEIAFAAARKIAEKGADTGFNPLFLHSGVGLGKTHLMHAIANQSASKFPERKVIYLSAEKFMHSFVRSLRDRKALEFKEELRSADILMIDDFQFIVGKESTQEEFFHTLNALVDSGKQMVISCDRCPSEFENIAERMRARLSSGLVMDIDKSDYELRLKILKSKVAEQGANIPDEILEFLAEKITSNIRELEGALNRITARASLVQKEVTIESATSWIADLLKVKSKEITLSGIQAATAEHFNIEVADLLSASRARNIARPRQIAMSLAKKLTTKSLPEIGKAFGGKDHTTVMHACKKVDELCENDSELLESIEALTVKLKN